MDEKVREYMNNLTDVTTKLNDATYISFKSLAKAIFQAMFIALHKKMHFAIDLVL